jgi:hypothetical protein
MEKKISIRIRIPGPSWIRARNLFSDTAFCIIFFFRVAREDIFFSCWPVHTTSTLICMYKLQVFKAAVDPDSLNPDRDTDPGFWWPKTGKKYSWIFFIFFGSKVAIYLCPSYRRSLQPSKENIQHFKKLKLLTFSMFVGHFCPPGSGSGSRLPSGYGSRDPIESEYVRIHNTGLWGCCTFFAVL